ncbi:hypothetical protein Bbelb_290460 [Branchiostoma belcheri]|nr:hypothetical protein Bbelb_290460 [Branchiostoma belcheri]
MRHNKFIKDVRYPAPDINSNDINVSHSVTARHCDSQAAAIFVTFDLTGGPSIIKGEGWLHHYSVPEPVRLPLRRFSPEEATTNFVLTVRSVQKLPELWVNSSALPDPTAVEEIPILLPTAKERTRKSVFPTVLWHHPFTYCSGLIIRTVPGCHEAGIDIAGIQEHRLITPIAIDELWSDDRSYVFMYSSAADRRWPSLDLDSPNRHSPPNRPHSD